MKTSTSESIGFIFEVISFLLAGYFLGIKELFLSFYCLIWALVFAFFTGSQIRKRALEDEYK